MRDEVNSVWGGAIQGLEAAAARIDSVQTGAVWTAEEHGIRQLRDDLDRAAAQACFTSPKLVVRRVVLYDQPSDRGGREVPHARHVESLARWKQDLVGIARVFGAGADPRDVRYRVRLLILPRADIAPELPQDGLWVDGVPALPSATDFEALWCSDRLIDVSLEPLGPEAPAMALAGGGELD